MTGGGNRTGHHGGEVLWVRAVDRGPAVVELEAYRLALKLFWRHPIRRASTAVIGVSRAESSSMARCMAIKYGARRPTVSPCSVTQADRQ